MYCISLPPSRSGSTLRRTRRAGIDRDDGPHLDRAVRDRFELMCPPHGIVERVALDRVVAAELLLRLRERPVGHEPLAAQEPDGLGLRHERCAVDEDAAFLQLADELPVGTGDLLEVV